MKSTEFIREDNDDNWDDLHDAAELRVLAKLQQEIIPSLDLIKQNCQPFLQQWGQQPLIRGVLEKGPVRQFIKKKVHLEDRIPKDTSKRLHTKFNKAFVDKFGLPFRNALFASGDYTVANEYGNVYTVFPTGNFKFIWSPEVDDLYGQWQQGEPHRQWDDPESEEYWQARLTMAEKHFIKNSISEYQTTDLNSAIESRHEIMIWTKSYYGISEALFEEHHEFIMEYLSAK